MPDAQRQPWRQLLCDERLRRGGLASDGAQLQDRDAGRQERVGEGDDYAAVVDVPLSPRQDFLATEEEREKEKTMFRAWQKEALKKLDGLWGGPGLLRDPTYARD